jgi:hypothetical protein
MMACQVLVRLTILSTAKLALEKLLRIHRTYSRPIVLLTAVINTVTSCIVAINNNNNNKCFISDIIVHLREYILTHLNEGKQTLTP